MTDLPKTSPLKTAMQAVDQRDKNDVLLLRAASMNLLLVRANQLGRELLTPTDMRKVDLILEILLGVPAESELLDARRFAAQLTEREPAGELVEKLEKALSDD